MTSGFPDISRLREDDLDALAALDASGCLVGRDEDFPAYAARLKTAQDAYAALEKELETGRPVEVFPGVAVNQASRIPQDVLARGSEVTRRLYGFQVDYVPGFFLTENVGLLWAGCSITDSESPLTVILLRRNFRNRERYLIYRRTELAAHELSHAGRSALFDLPLEEFFAYQTGNSRFRRYLGNCFLHQHDAVLFLLPVLCLLCASFAQVFFFHFMPMWPFWIFAALYPAYLLMRNHLSIRILRRAERKLKALGSPDPLPLLFRSTFPEMRRMGSCRTAEELTELLENWKKSSLRWRVAAWRFLPR